jgi:hypothetical protein
MFRSTLIKTLFATLVISCTPTTTYTQVNFDQLNEFEQFIEESDVAAEKMKEVKISAATQRTLQAVSWIYVQCYTLKQKIAAFFSALIFWRKKEVA